MDLERLPEYAVSDYIIACTSNYSTKISGISVLPATWFLSISGLFSALQV